MGLLVEGGQEEVFDAEIFVFEFFGGLSGATEEGLEAGSDIDAASGGARAGDLG
jgi:hypothetical protein